MDIIATSLEALIQRATSPSNAGTDTAAVDAFCGMVNKEPDSAHIAAKLITTRIQSPQEWEALQGLNVLEACMKRCGTTFHAEVGKFRFLNEMIKLVSPKYLGSQTPKPVRDRVLQLMYAWTVEHPKESKIKEAFQMLRKQGVVTDDPPIDGSGTQTGASTSESIGRTGRNSVFEDDKKQRLLQKLLQSKNREDLQAANRLIKTMVKEDEKRTEMISRRATELGAISNNARLLSEMLECYRPGSSSKEDLDLINELHQSCERYSFQLSQELKPEESLYGDVVEVMEELNKVFAAYQQVIIQGRPMQSSFLSMRSKPTQSTAISADALLDLSTPSEETLPMPVRAVNNQLADLGLDVNSSQKQTDIDALGDIFGGVSASGVQSSSLVSTNAAVLQPVSLPHSTTQGTTNSTSSKMSEEKPGTLKALEDLDALGASMLKQSLPAACRAGSQFNKVATKVPMNQLGRSLSGTSEKGLNISAVPAFESSSLTGGGDDRAQSSSFDLDFLVGGSSPSTPALQANMTNLEKSESLLNGDDAMVDLSEDSLSVHPSQSTPVATITSDVKETEVVFQTQSKGTSNSNSGSGVGDNKSESCSKVGEMKPLNDIFVSLDTIKPGPVPPLSALEERNGISVVLHLAQDTPRPDVSVYVVSTISKNSSPLFNYVFQAVVPKTCKLRLLQASSSELPAHNPFLPPAAITQVMLVANPSKVAVNLKFMVSYTMDDETVTEMGDVESLPMLS